MSTPSIETSLARFVEEAKRHGVPDESLVALLRQNGWSDRRIYENLTAYYGKALGMDPPSRSGPAENARDAFYYLLNFITLGFWTVALGQVFYSLIQRSFPDVTGIAPGPLLDDIAWQLATIVVAFPIFLFIHFLIERALKLRPEMSESPVRLWLTYIALVIAALVVLGDGIWFVQSFLRGQLTVRFLLDSLVLFVLAGGVFFYYLTGLRRTSVDE